MAAKNKPPRVAIAALAAAVFVVAFATINHAAATTIAPAKDRMAQVIIGGKTIAVEVTPVFAKTEWTDINKDGTTTTMRIAQTIPMTKQIIAGDKTATIDIQNNGRNMAILGNKTITIEIADDNESRIKGLSARQTISGGMLFVYSAPKIICLWMKNTHISLEALFLQKDGTIINSAQMIPHTSTPHCAATKAKYALELPADWRRKNNVMDAKKVILPPLNNNNN